MDAPEVAVVHTSHQVVLMNQSERSSKNYPRNVCSSKCRIACPVLGICYSPSCLQHHRRQRTAGHCPSPYSEGELQNQLRGIEPCSQRKAGCWDLVVV